MTRNGRLKGLLGSPGGDWVTSADRSHEALVYVTFIQVKQAMFQDISQNFNVSRSQAIY